MEKNLEEIFWKEGKFVNKKGIYVSPKPVGRPIQIKVKTSKNVLGGTVCINYHKKFYNLLDNLFKNRDEQYKEANAFSKEQFESIHYGFPSPSEAIFVCNFYKI